MATPLIALTVTVTAGPRTRRRSFASVRIPSFPDKAKPKPTWLACVTGHLVQWAGSQQAQPPGDGIGANGGKPVGTQGHYTRWLVGTVLGLGMANPALAGPKGVPDFVLQPAPAASASPWQVSGRVVFQGKSPTKVPAVGIALFLTAANGQIVDRGQTDVTGLYILSAPGPGRYEVRVDQSATTRRHGALVAPFKQLITLP
jgi:hypothetical protein